MQLECIKCEKKLEIEDERLEKVAKFVKENGLKGDAYLKYFNVAEGYNCTGDKEHEFNLDPAEDKLIHDSAKGHSEAVKANEVSHKKQQDLNIQIEKLKLEMQQETVKQQESLKVQEECLEDLQYRTGNKDPAIWL